VHGRDLLFKVKLNRMKKRINPEELFEGALVRQQDMDTYTAVITKIRDDLVDTVDVYGWHENLNQPLNSIKPAHLTGGFALQRIGFLRDVSSINPQFLLETPSGRLTVFQRETEWLLTDGQQSIPVMYAHQVQAASKRLWGITITVAPPGTDEQPEEDYYIE
jgi:hypothetical protein